MPRPAQLPSPFNEGPFSTRMATTEGISAERLRRSDLLRPYWGVRLQSEAAHGTETSLLELCRAYATRMPADAVFSHLTAARLLGMPLPVRFDSDQRLHVATPPQRRALRANGVRGHKLKLDAPEIVVVGGIPLTSPARTWSDLARGMSVEDLVVLGDYVLARESVPRSRRKLETSPREPATPPRKLATPPREPATSPREPATSPREPATSPREPMTSLRQPLTSPEQLTVAVSRALGRPGQARLALALPVLSDRSESPTESRFRFRFLQAGLPPAIPNRDIHTESGVFVARPDLSFPEYRELFDYEGKHHLTDEQQWHRDIRRVRILEDCGWHSTRGTKADLRNSDELISRLARLLRAKGWQG